MQNLACPCGSGENFKVCCEEILAGNRLASTPLQLMRSRYTAHVYKNMQHIISTMRGKALKLFDEEKTVSEWFTQCEWQKLEILSASPITKYTKEGVVEFKAYYLFNGVEQILHERSKFIKDDGQWYYVAGQQKDPLTKPIVKPSIKVGRNDDCPCNSGKKYKKCCAT